MTETKSTKATAGHYQAVMKDRLIFDSHEYVKRMTSPHFSPGDAMIAPDFLRQRVPATMSVSGIRLRKHVPAGAKKTSKDVSSAVCDDAMAGMLS